MVTDSYIPPAPVNNDYEAQTNQQELPYGSIPPLVQTMGTYKTIVCNIYLIGLFQHTSRMTLANKYIKIPILYHLVANLVFVHQ